MGVLSWHGTCRVYVLLSLHRCLFGGERYDLSSSIILRLECWISFNLFLVIGFHLKLAIGRT